MQVGDLPESMCRMSSHEPVPGPEYPQEYLDFRKRCKLPADTKVTVVYGTTFYNLHLKDQVVVEREGLRGGLSDSQLARIWHQHADDDTACCHAPSELYLRWSLVNQHPWITRDLRTIFHGDESTWFPVYHLVASETEMEQIGDGIQLYDFGILTISDNAEVEVDAPALTLAPLSSPEERYVRQHLMFLLRQVSRCGAMSAKHAISSFTCRLLLSQVAPFLLPSLERSRIAIL